MQGANERKLGLRDYPWLIPFMFSSQGGDINKDWARNEWCLVHLSPIKSSNYIQLIWYRFPVYQGIWQGTTFKTLLAAARLQEWEGGWCRPGGGRLVQGQHQSLGGAGLSGSWWTSCLNHSSGRKKSLHRNTIWMEDTCHYGNSTALWTDTSNSSHVKEPSPCVTGWEAKCWGTAFDEWSLPAKPWSLWIHYPAFEIRLDHLASWGS